MVQVGLSPTRQPQIAEPLHKQVSRFRARWLNRLMYSDVGRIEKVLGYVIYAHLNCVTLDAWPAQGTIATLMRCSIKTVQRASEALERHGWIVVARSRSRGSMHRYAPIFAPGDLDESVPDDGHPCPGVADTHVRQSSLSTRIKSSPTGQRWSNTYRRPNSSYKPAERGRWELELASALGRDGREVLDRLDTINDTVVEKLCRAYCDGEVGECEIEAARLAAAQVFIARSRR
jgi:Helix-turn-helix domain